MKTLKKIEISGEKLKVERYRPLITESESPYDHAGGDHDKELEAFDRYSLKNLLQDNMESDPAVRYQYVKNQFERRLTDAAVSAQLELLLLQINPLVLLTL